jgi:hypothetical protein
MAVTLHDKPQVTIYSPSDHFGNIVRTEGLLLDHGRRPYAQYESCPFVLYVPRGKRTALLKRQAEQEPYLLIVAGWGRPQPPGMFGPDKESNGALVARSVYRSFDPRWRSDFDRLIAPLAEHFVADYRTASQRMERFA